MATRQSTRNGTARNGRRSNGSSGATHRTSSGNGSATTKPRSGERTAREAVVRDVALGGTGPRTAPGLATVKLGAKLALRPHRLAQRGLGLTAELARVAAGQS